MFWIGLFLLFILTVAVLHISFTTSVTASRDMMELVTEVQRLRMAIDDLRKDERFRWH